MLGMVDSLWDRLWPSGPIGLVAAVVLLTLVKGPKFWASALLTRNRAQQMRDAIEEQQIRSIRRWYERQIQWRDAEIEQLRAENTRLRSQPPSQSSGSS